MGRGTKELWGPCKHSMFYFREWSCGCRQLSKFIKQNTSYTGTFSQLYVRTAYLRNPYFPSLPESFGQVSILCARYVHTKEMFTGQSEEKGNRASLYFPPCLSPGKEISYLTCTFILGMDIPGQGGIVSAPPCSAT